MSWTFTTSGAAIAKAGAYANTTIVASSATLATWSDFAEARIVMESRKDYLTDYSSLSTAVQGLLNDTASDLIALNIIRYDQQGTQNVEIQVMLDGIRDNAQKNLQILRDFKAGDIRSAV